MQIQKLTNNIPQPSKYAQKSLDELHDEAIDRAIVRNFSAFQDRTIDFLLVETKKQNKFFNKIEKLIKTITTKKGQ